MVKKFDEITKLVNRYIANLKGQLQIDKVILFGSYAEGKAVEDSDIDLAIISPDVTDDNLIECLQLVTRAIPRHFDIALEPLVFSDQQYNTASDIEFLGEIKKNGKLIYQKKPKGLHFN